MSLVGTRPPTVDEWEQYELHHRSSRADIGKDCYLEVSYVHSEAKVGEHCVLSYIDIHNAKRKNTNV